MSDNIKVLYEMCSYDDLMDIEKEAIAWAANRIIELEAKVDAANAVAKAYVEQVDELEALYDALVIDASEDVQATHASWQSAYDQLEAKHTALRDEVRELPEYMCNFPAIRKMGAAYRKRDVLALLGKEKDDE